MKPTLIAEDRQLLFTLLGAIDDDGRLPNDSTAGRRWPDLRATAIASHFHPVGFMRGALV